MLLVLLYSFPLLPYLERRAIMRHVSGGPFFAPFHINRGISIIHVAPCVSSRHMSPNERDGAR